MEWTVVLAGPARKSLRLTSIDRPARISVVLRDTFRVRILEQVPGSRKFMKQVVILLLVAFMLSGCGSNNPVQAGAGGLWQAALTGGDGQASGLSFVAQFSLSSNALSFSSFEFINNEPGACFPINPSGETGIANLTYNTADQVTGTMSITVPSGGNTLTLTSTTVTGTINTHTSVLSGGVVTGTWMLAGGTGCNGSGDFTMTQSLSTP